MMKKMMRTYQITKEQFENTEWQPNGHDVDIIETEPGWNYGDIIDNMGTGLTAEQMTDAVGLTVWKVYADDPENATYIVELADDYDLA